jgi:hypothetical protein
VPEDAKAELSRELGGDVAAIAELTDGEAAHLVTLIQDARRRQGKTLSAAIDHSLGSLPAVLRRPVRMIVGA